MLVWRCTGWWFELFYYLLNTSLEMTHGWSIYVVWVAEKALVITLLNIQWSWFDFNVVKTSNLLSVSGFLQTIASLCFMHLFTNNSRSIADIIIFGWYPQNFLKKPGLEANHSLSNSRNENMNYLPVINSQENPFQ